MYNLLEDQLIGCVLRTGAAQALSLPDVLAALMRDEVESFPALRPHQRHAWHALLCQLGALACLRGDVAAPPRAAEPWRALLRALTPTAEDDAPWHLVEPPQQPAFLQPPVPGGDLKGFKLLATPDELDVLVTAKNHDVKTAQVAYAAPDDWLFALVTLQTMEGYSGARNYGISRMNSGYGNRPGLSMAPDGGMGAHVARDMARLMEVRAQVLDRYPGYGTDGLALLWLAPWDGVASLSLQSLDPYYVEICRRVRLEWTGDRLAARMAGSSAARVHTEKESAGNTGDPWTPLETTKEGVKALTVDGRGFGYRRLSAILSARGFTPAPLQTIGAGEREARPYVLVCRALARGQGKTEGLHERRIRVPPAAVRCFAPEGMETLAAISKARVEQVGDLERILRRALMVLFQNGPARADYAPQDPGSAKRAEGFRDGFDAAVDAGFFAALFEEAIAPDEAAQVALRARWLSDLFGTARAVLAAAEAGAPVSAVRRLRARVRAEATLAAGFHRAFADIYFSKEPAMAPTRGPALPARLVERVNLMAKGVRSLLHQERTGDLAALRRLDCARPFAPAFFALLAANADWAQAPEEVQRCAALAQILALKPDALSEFRLGRVLAETFGEGIEDRVQKLLCADGEALVDQVRLLARRLAGAGVVPYRELGALLLVEDPAEAEQVRFAIARDFWGALDHARSEPAQSASESV